MVNTLKESLIGKRFKTPDGDISPTIIDVKMKQFVEPDGPANDWWGKTWYEVCAYFETPTEWKNPTPIKNVLNYEVI
jgi:hypothetical protein